MKKQLEAGSEAPGAAPEPRHHDEKALASEQRAAKDVHLIKKLTGLDGECLVAWGLRKLNLAGRSGLESCSCSVVARRRGACPA